MTFKIGDKVKCLDSSFTACKLQQDEIYEVSSVSSGGKELRFASTGKSLWCIDRFEAIQPKQFSPKPGDKIICNNGEKFVCCTLETLKDKFLGRANIADADFFGYSKRLKNGWMHWTVETLNGNGDWCAKEVIPADMKEGDKEEPRYTMQEIKEAWEASDWIGVTSNWNTFQKNLSKINSPEYQEYLRLKAIYE